MRREFVANGAGALPRISPNIEPGRIVLKSIRKGIMPGIIKVKYPDFDVDHIYKSLHAFGLIEHLEIVSNTPEGGNVFFLTEKGLRWLRTYDWWERSKYWLSKWQLIWGIILGVWINMLSNVVWPHFESGIEAMSPASETLVSLCGQGVCVRFGDRKYSFQRVQ